MSLSGGPTKVTVTPRRPSAMDGLGHRPLKSLGGGQDRMPTIVVARGVWQQSRVEHALPRDGVPIRGHPGLTLRAGIRVGPRQEGARMTVGLESEVRATRAVADHRGVHHGVPLRA